MIVSGGVGSFSTDFVVAIPEDKIARDLSPITLQSVQVSNVAISLILWLVSVLSCDSTTLLIPACTPYQGLTCARALLYLSLPATCDEQCNLRSLFNIFPTNYVPSINRLDSHSFLFLASKVFESGKNCINYFRYQATASNGNCSPWPSIPTSVRAIL